VFTSPLNSAVLSTPSAFCVSDGLEVSSDAIGGNDDSVLVEMPLVFGVSLDVDSTTASRGAGEPEEIAMADHQGARSVSSEMKVES